MIKEIKINDPNALPVEWWPEVPALKDKTSFVFEPGLTILWGRNGCGKSTLLRLIARLFHCDQGGSPTITKSSICNFFDSGKKLFDGASALHDGQPVYFFNAEATPGLDGGSFDYDFLGDALRQLRSRKISSGQRLTMNMASIFKSFSNQSPVQRKIKRECLNDYWQERYDIAVKVIDNPTEGKGPPTLLLDEPTRSIDIVNEHSFWSKTPTGKDRQIIAATHSLFALNIPGAHYIDLEPPYLEECREVFKKFTDSTKPKNGRKKNAK